ncbi:ATP-binding protein [Leptospira sp. GIMC2001]|uniref:ATP-binding protein n=1 Tax=Leptospira sp. GIMC2001 TaxID=1513297 RepID=UPI00234B6E48|nr:ATP-binding protein [Leptospira sp. GIMC2001]WCL51019.1 ATP-binding protein [Leptospira sp. GIMC2001]
MFKILKFKNKFHSFALNEGKTSEKSNFFTILIGNNGTGKSNILRDIIKFFVSIKLELDTDIKSIGTPKKIFALTNTQSDKFPYDKFEKFKKDPIKYNNSKYFYLGSKNSYGSNNRTYQLSRAIDIIISNFKSIKLFEKLNEVFKFLELQPIIKIDFNFTKNTLENIGKLKELDLEDFYHYLDQNLDEDIIDNQRILKNYRELFNYIDRINEKLEKNQNKISLILNFSDKFIEKRLNIADMYVNLFAEYAVLHYLQERQILKKKTIKIYNSNNAEFDFKEASSGESNMLVQLLPLCALLQDDSLIIIDEPEVSLHPLWQSKYLELLNKILIDSNGCHVFIATHSHLLLADIPIENSEVIILRKDKNELRSKKIDYSTFGWSAENILLEVFKMPTTRNFYTAELVSRALEILAEPNNNINELNIIKRQLNEIFPNLKNYDPLHFIISEILNENNFRKN